MGNTGTVAVADRVKREGIGKLALAGRTKVSRALPLHDLFDRRTAHAAWQPRAIIDEIIELEITAFTIAADEITQRAAAFFDRGSKRDSHRIREQPVADQRNTASGRGGPDTGAKQAFGRVNIAHPHHDLPRQQRLLDGDLAPARLPVHQRAGKSRRKRFDPEAGQQLMLEHIAVFARVPKDGPKASRVAIAENELVENPVDM